jgi:hypothetical protein
VLSVLVARQGGARQVRPLPSAVMPATDPRAAFDLASDRKRAMKVQIAF